MVFSPFSALSQLFLQLNFGQFINNLYFCAAFREKSYDIATLLLTNLHLGAYISAYISNQLIKLYFFKQMRKLLLLFVALLGTVGAWAQPDVTGKSFTLQCARGYVYFNGSVLAGTATADNASKFAIVSYENETYLYDATQKAFVCHTNLNHTGANGNPALESNNDFSKAVKGLSFGTTGIETYPYYLAETTYNTWLNMDGTPKVYFNTWQNFENGNGGNTYKVEIVDASFDATEAVAMLDAYFNPSATVTYIISDASGVVFNSGESPANVGETITSLPDEMKRAFCTYSAINTTIVEGANTINVTVNYDLPFETGTGKLYYAKLRNHYVYYDATNTDVRANQSSKENTDAYRWSFYGKPYSGIKVKNAATGTYLDNTSSSVQLSAEGYAWTIHRLNQSSTFGLYNGSNYINEQNTGNHNLIYWGQFTTDLGSQWNVEEVPDITVDVTYDLYVGGEKVNTVVDEQVAANSAVSIPASLTTSYSSLAYDFASSGTIGETDCTVTVTATPKAGVVTDLANLSNAKAYKLTTERGDLYIKSDHLASNSNANVGATAGKFAVLTYEDSYYLYSVDASKFVLGDGSLSETPTSAIATLAMTAQNIKPLYLMVLGGKGLNVTDTSDDYELVINTWVTADAGNRYCITEVEDFDASGALAALEDYFHGTTAFNNAIAELEGYTYGTGLNQYSLVVENNDYTSQAATIISGLKGQGYSAENLATAQQLLYGTSINLPATGKFYRIKGYSNNYITSGEDNYYATMNGTANTNNIVYYSADNNLIFFGSGYGLYQTCKMAPAGSTLNAYTFSQGAQMGKYYVKSNAKTYDNSHGEYCYDHTNSGSGDILNRNSGPVTSGSYQTDWTLEEITTLPVNITSAGYATLYSPVALTIPTGVQAYYISSLTSTEATLTEITTTIPAETPVILAGSEGTYNFATTTADAFSGTNKLEGQIVAISVSADDVTNKVYYTLQQNVAGDAVGLFPKTAAGSIAGFKAYLPASNLPSADVKGFTFNFEGTDGITSVVNGTLTEGNEAIYNLAGQRMNKLQRGINIVNGKKFIVK